MSPIHSYLPRRLGALACNRRNDGKEIGCSLGTGSMIAIPNQSSEKHTSLNVPMPLGAHPLSGTPLSVC